MGRNVGEERRGRWKKVRRGKEVRSGEEARRGKEEKEGGEERLIEGRRGGRNRTHLTFFLHLCYRILR